MPELNRKQTQPMSAVFQRIIFLTGLLFFTGIGTAETQDLDIGVKPRNGALTVKIVLKNTPSDEILTSLTQGLRAEIHYHIRIYKRSYGFLKFFGDRLVEEATSSYEAKWDMFRKQFVVCDTADQERYFTTAEDFLRFFFSCPEYTISTLIQEPASYYLLAQSNIKSTKMVPPFTLLSAFVPAGTITTPWTRKDLDPNSLSQD